MNKLLFTDTDINDIIDNLEYNLSKIDKFEDTYYFDSYFEFLKYFENIESLSYHSLIISSHFTYGWMPTIINLNSTFTTDSIDILNKVKNNTEMDNDEYLTLVKCINNSIVGVSKLLHFISPKQYPIFDSRIKNYFKVNKLFHSVYKHTNSKEKDVLQYQIYRSICMEIICNDRFDKIYDETLIKLGISKALTKMRVLENLFFYLGKKTMNWNEIEIDLKKLFQKYDLMANYENDKEYLKNSFEKIEKMWLETYNQIDSINIIMVSESPLFGKNETYIYNKNTNPTSFFTFNDMKFLPNYEEVDTIPQTPYEKKEMMINQFIKSGFITLDIFPFPLNEKDTSINYRKMSKKLYSDIFEFYQRIIS